MPDVVSSWKVPAMPSKLCQMTYRLVGALHTMSVLEAYQADLLEEINVDKRIPQDEVLELHSATDHVFWAP